MIEEAVGIDQETLRRLDTILTKQECERERRILQYICRPDRDRSIVLMLYGAIKNR